MKLKYQPILTCRSAASFGCIEKAGSMTNHPASHHTGRWIARALVVGTTLLFSTGPLSAAKLTRNEGILAQFPYRGGTVVYSPASGSNWVQTPKSRAKKKQIGGKLQSSRVSAGLPQGCMVYACVKAEEIRHGKHPGLSRSQVISFQHSEGRHSFLTYWKDGALYAEDHRRFPVRMASSYERRSALALSREFVSKSTPGSVMNPPISAYVLGASWSPRSRQNR